MARSVNASRGGFVTQTDAGEREICHQIIILRLLFEKGLQFAARLLPGFMGGSVIARKILRPA